MAKHVLSITTLFALALMLIGGVIIIDGVFDVFGWFTFAGLFSSVMIGGGIIIISLYLLGKVSIKK
jgi:hypothetical protein